jgi:signal recognition particle subunit SEC65
MSTEQFDRRSPGEITRSELKKKGVKSPSTKHIIKIAKNLRIAVEKPFENDIEKEKFILRMKAKYGV